MMLGILGAAQRFGAAPAPFVGRQTFYAARDTRDTVTGTTAWADHLTLDWQPDADSTYFILAQCVGDYSTSSGDDSMGVRLQDTIGATTLVEFADLPFGVAPALTTPFPMATVMTFGSSPAAQQLKLQFKTANSSRTTGCAYGRILIIKASANDKYVQTAGPTLGEDSYTTAATLSFTPPSSGDYLMLWGGEVQNATSTSNGYRVKLDKSGAVQEFIGEWSPLTTAEWFPVLGVMYQSALSGSQSYTVQVRNNAGFGGDANLRNAFAIALRLDDFEGANIDTDYTGASYNADTSDQIAVDLSLTPAAKRHIVIGGAFIAPGNSGIAALRTKLQIGGASQITATPNNGNPAGRVSLLFLHRADFAASPTTLALTYATSSTGTTVAFDEATLALLRTET